MFLFLDDEIESKITNNSGEAESSAHAYCILTVTLLFQYFLLFPNQTEAASTATNTMTFHTP